MMMEMKIHVGTEEKVVGMWVRVFVCSSLARGL